MKKYCWCLLLILPALFANAPQNDYKLMEGIWDVTGGEKDGKDIPFNEIMNREVVVEGNRYVVKEAGKVIDQGTFKLDAAKTPKTIDVKPTQGPNAGKTLLGIYELQGDERKTCMAAAGQPRPKDFTTKPGSDEVVIKYKREKGKK